MHVLLFLPQICIKLFFIYLENVLNTFSRAYALHTEVTTWDDFLYRRGLHELNLFPLTKSATRPANHCHASLIKQNYAVTSLASMDYRAKYGLS